ncbi:hypothetical protein [Agarilytica rhodophyticola]|uniref:hypothetical protein n=1 Tax=Agarilytica rhodophyticola TaxID=1737490 RepID=UPI000B346783|nr:hypothetical protein [Agarilytica rhodophyticola]
MKVLVAILLTVLLTACTPSLMSFTEGGWDITGVVDNVERLAGPEAVDCGFHDLQGAKGQGSVLYGIECVRRAIIHKRSVKFGTNEALPDSTVTEILIRTQDKKYWTVLYERMLDSDELRLSVHACESIKIHRDSNSYESKKCVEQPTSKWL